MLVRKLELLNFISVTQCPSITVQNLNAYRTTVFTLWSSGWTPWGLISGGIISEDHTASSFRPLVRNVATYHTDCTVSTYENTMWTSLHRRGISNVNNSTSTEIWLQHCTWNEFFRVRETHTQGLTHKTASITKRFLWLPSGLSNFKTGT